MKWKRKRAAAKQKRTTQVLENKMQFTLACFRAFDSLKSQVITDQFINFN